MIKRHVDGLVLQKILEADQILTWIKAEYGHAIEDSLRKAAQDLEIAAAQLTAALEVQMVERRCGEIE